MNARLVILSSGLVGAGALAWFYFRNRSSGASADAIESGLQSAAKLADPTAAAEDRPFLEEVFVTIQKLVPDIVPQGASGSRGIRNNNPGNIRKTGDKWQGLAAVQDDPAFFKFTHAKYGVRALGRLLSNYESKYGLRTVRDLIARWAPGHENPTDKYVAFVARNVGVNVDTIIDVRANLPKLAEAIIRFENGTAPYSMSDIQTWVYLP